MMNARTVWFVGLLVAALTTIEATAQDPAKTLVGVEKTVHFEIRFRPGSRAEASVDRVKALVEDDLALILKELGLTQFQHVIRLFLYDDVAELQKITGVGAAGYSIPLESHVPHDNDQTRVHELVHVVAEKFTEKGPEKRNLFLAEGLANAVLRFVHGVSIDAVAAFHKTRGELPPLAELLGAADFYAWLTRHPGFNGYDVGGSYARFLLDTYGAAKVRKYYCGVPAREAFGADVPSIEKAWHARLDKVTLRPGLLALLEERTDGPAAALRRSPEAKLDEKILGPATAWTKLARATIPKGAPGAWTADPSGAPVLALTGTASDGDWCLVRVGDDEHGDAMLRCTAEPGEGCYGLQIRLGPKCQGLVLRGQGAFIYTDVGGIAHDPKTSLGDKPVDIVLRRAKGRAHLWIDGKLVCEAPIDSAAAPISVGSVGGKARFRDLAVRP